MPSLVHFTLDPFCRRLRLALSEYGVPVELIDEEPWEPSADIFELNPAGTLPVYLEDAATPLSGIEAIGEYLEETKSTRISLIPGDAFARAEVRRLTGWFDGKFYAEVSEPVLTEKVIRRFMRRESGGGGPDTVRVRQAMARLRNHLDYIGHLADRRPWLAGSDLSLADLAAAAHLSAVDYFGDVPWHDYPAAKSWYQRVKSRPSFRPLLADTIRGMAPGPHYANLDF
jgi:glutathione S-transferase